MTCSRTLIAWLLLGILLPPATAFSSSQSSLPLAIHGEQTIYRRYLHEHFSRAARLNPHSAAVATPLLGSLNLSGLEVSADTATGRFRQVEPIAGRFDNGNYVALWRDDQNGTDVLVRRRFDGNLGAMGSQTPLFGDGMLRRPTGLTGASDGRTFVAGWLDNVTGHFSVSFLDSLGQVVSSASANLNPLPELIGAPTLGRTFPRGHVAVWEEFRNGGWHIYSQRFDSSGVRVGGNVNVDEGSNTPLRLEPAVAGDTAGGYIITWMQGDNTRSDIWARVFNSAGAAVGPAFAVTTAVATEAYMLPTATYVPATDQFWLGYIMADPTNDSTSLHLRRTDRAGVFVGSVAAPAAYQYPWEPQALHMDTSIVIITTRYDNLAEIRALALDTAAGVIDSSETVNDPAFNTRSRAFAISEGDTVMVVWQDRRSGEEDIRGRLRTDAANAGADMKLNEEATGGQQIHPAIVPQNTGGVRVAFTDTQRDGGDIAWVSVSEDGTVTDRSVVGDDSTGATQFDPAAAYDSTGRVLVTWTDERTDWPGPARHAAGQFISSAGTPDGASFSLAATNTASSQTATDVAMTLDGRAAVAWLDNRSGTGETYVRLFDATDAPVTGDLPANDGNTGLTVAFEATPDVSIDSLNRVWVAWAAENTVSDSFHLLVQSFYFDGSRRGATIDLSPLGPTAGPPEFALHALGTGGLRMVWADPDSIDRGIWLRDYDSLGTPIAAARRISDSGVTVQDPFLWVDQFGRYAVAWSQATGSGPEIIWQRFHPNDTPADTLERLSPDPTASIRRLPVIAPSQTFLYAAWHDNAATGRGFNVRLSSILYAPAGIDDDQAVQPNRFALYANYPNPFNPETVIRFYLPTPAKTELEVFNILGRRVRSVNMGALAAGEHAFTWDGRDSRGAEVGSGVYFYRVRAGEISAVRKMLLLR